MKLARALRDLAAVFVLGTASAAQEPRAQLTFEPAHAAVGEAVRATLRLEHAQGEHPTLAAAAFDDSWIVFESGPGLDAPLAQDPARVATTWELQVASLEPGARAPAALALKLGETTVPVDCAKLTVQGVLAEDEDAPRELRGLREIEAAGERESSWTWIAAAAALICALAVAWFAWRARKRPASVGVPAPSVRLAQLEAQPLDTPEDVQAAYFALTRLLRESADLRSGRDLSGLTDEEWRVAASAQLDAAGFGEAERAGLERLLAEASRVKYGRERPTHWATREALAHARELAKRFEEPLAPRTAAESQRGRAA